MFTDYTTVSALESCRHGDLWPVPRVFAVEIIAPESQVTAAPNQGASSLVLLLLNDRDAERLASGELEFSALPKGPISGGAPPSAGQLKTARALAYESDGPLLRPVAVNSFRATLDVTQSDRVIDAINHPVRLPNGDPAADVIAQNLSREMRAFFATIEPSGIMIHHSAILPLDPNSPADQYLDAFHAKRGFSIECGGRTYHVAYHYIIRADGKLELGRPDRCEGAHTKGFNDYIGIVLVGNFSSRDNRHGRKGPQKPTREQLARLVTLCRHLREQYHIPIQRVVCHGDVGRTECPGDAFPFREFLRELLQTSAA
jgi:hypothetical protein